MTRTFRVSNLTLNYQNNPVDVLTSKLNDKTFFSLHDLKNTVDEYLHAYLDIDEPYQTRELYMHFNTPTDKEEFGDFQTDSSFIKAHHITIHVDINAFYSADIKAFVVTQWRKDED